MLFFSKHALFPFPFSSCRKDEGTDLQEIIILLNPWDLNTPVSFPGSSSPHFSAFSSLCAVRRELKEYVENEEGRGWTGTAASKIALPWLFVVLLSLFIILFSLIPLLSFALICTGSMSSSHPCHWTLLSISFFQ